MFCAWQQTHRAPRQSAPIRQGGCHSSTAQISTVRVTARSRGAAGPGTRDSRRCLRQGTPITAGSPVVPRASQLPPPQTAGRGRYVTSNVPGKGEAADTNPDCRRWPTAPLLVPRRQVKARLARGCGMRVRVRVNVRRRAGPGLRTLSRDRKRSQVAAGTPDLQLIAMITVPGLWRGALEGHF